MGSGATKAAPEPVDKHQRHQQEAERSSLIKKVERFVINVYASFPRSESMRIILSSDLAKDSFQSFLKSESAEECFSLYQDVSNLRQNMPSNLYALSKEMNKIVAQYVRTGTDSQVMISFALQESCMASLSADPYDDGYTEKMFQLCGELQEEAIMLMARDLFNRFLLSKHYKAWRASESSHAMATTVADTKNLPSGKSKQKTNGNENVKVNLRRATDLSLRAFANVDMDEIGRLLGAENWLAALLAAVEGLPLSFTLATARSDRKGFPLIYVNKYFEKITGFSRSDVLGKNCRFLQSEEANIENRMNLSLALQSAKPTTVLINNRTLDKKEFINLVSLKPIFDDKGVYCYVMGIQIDCTREKNGYDDMIKLAEDLMEMLPDVIFTDDV